MKIILTIALIICIAAPGYIYSWKQNIKKELAKECLNNIKSGRKNQMSDSLHTQVFENYNFEALKAKEVINMADDKTYKLSELLNHPNLFIDFCLVGSGHFEIEMAMMQEFYDKYKGKINFILLSEEEPDLVRDFFKKHQFTVPFYVINNDKFPVGIKVFPTNHLIINHKTAFLYAGIGYFDNKDFYAYVDSVLVK